MCEINPLELVLARIECEMADQGVYGLLNNNCECYATYCRQGVSKSQQKVWCIGKIKEWTSGLAVRVVITLVRIFLELLFAEVVEEAIEGDSMDNTNTTDNVNHTMLNTFFLLKPKQQEQGFQMSSCLNNHQIIGVGIFTFFEFLVFLYHFRQYRSQWKKGNIYRRDYFLRVMSTFTEFLFRTICASFFSILAECLTMKKHYPEGQNPSNSQIAIVITAATLSGLGGAILGQILMLILCFVCRCGKMMAKCITGKDYRVITKLEELSPGSHVIHNTRKCCSSKQHGIIVSTNQGENSFQQIYYSREGGEIQSLEQSFNSLWRVYKVFWRKHESCSNQETVDRAIGRLRQDSEPSFMPHSSTDFAYWCKSHPDGEFYFDAGDQAGPSTAASVARGLPG